jgi:hypothetical protein
MIQIMSVTRVRVSHRKKSSPRMLTANLAVPSNVAIEAGRRPASAYHRLTDGDKKIRTCAGECVNRICIECKLECNECMKDICPCCAFSDDAPMHEVAEWQPSLVPVLCRTCVVDTVPSHKRHLWCALKTMPETCFWPSHQHVAMLPVQRNPVQRRLDFDNA